MKDEFPDSTEHQQFKQDKVQSNENHARMAEVIFDDPRLERAEKLKRVSELFHSVKVS